MSSTEILCNDPAIRGPVGVMATTAELTQPDFITVEQAAAIIGIGRTCAYQLARRAADFGEGTFPAVRFGKQLRVPRRKLEDLTGGPITVPAGAGRTITTTSHDEPDTTTNTDHPPTTNTVDTPTDLPQPPLPFTE
jgi:hypothetical protein